MVHCLVNVYKKKFEISRGLEWWYRSDEADRYISGIKVGRTFLASELWVYYVFLCILELLCWMLDVCCLLLELTHLLCSMSYRDLIVVVILNLFFWCLLYHEFQCRVMGWYGKRLGNTNDGKWVLMSWERTSL